MLKKFMITVMILSCILIISCGGGDGDSSTDPGINDMSSDDLLSKGWQKFSGNDYIDAIDYFDKLIERNEYITDAYCGRGWSYMYLDELNIALSNFNHCLMNAPGFEVLNDCSAGLSFVFDAMDNPEKCIEYSDAVSSEWSFQYKDINYEDILLLRALNYYAMGDFDESLDELQKIFPTFTPDVSTVEGRAALADKLEELLG